MTKNTLIKYLINESYHKDYLMSSRLSLYGIALVSLGAIFHGLQKKIRLIDCDIIVSDRTFERRQCDYSTNCSHLLAYVSCFIRRKATHSRYLSNHHHGKTWF